MQPLLLVGSVTKLPISPFHIFLVLSLTGLSLNVLNHPNFNEEVDIILNRSHNKPMLTWNLNAVRSNKLTAAFLFAIHAVFATCCIKKAVVILGTKNFINICLFGLLTGSLANIVDFFSDNQQQQSLFND